MKHENEVSESKVLETFAFDDFFRAAEGLIRRDKSKAAFEDIGRTDDGYSASVVILYPPYESLCSDDLPRYLDFAAKWGTQFHIEADTVLPDDHDGGPLPHLVLRFSVLARKLE